ncbi:hypothetical protein DCS_02992 [Drechmeria coniospora]|uniref:Pectinesterase inhibitor domain-containing protein n=1 Tax=Drechmeria coniospora TaxID=98403 RepID=A0A151GXL9_DRECN|nr:hypothetical protein DCS_02992 [Drechmeria coniospora]KYK61848.1 hypothetical protein DCS_02992 [Drechmeria coniospora]
MNYSTAIAILLAAIASAGNVGRQQARSDPCSRLHEATNATFTLLNTFDPTDKKRVNEDIVASLQALAQAANDCNAYVALPGTKLSSSSGAIFNVVASSAENIEMTRMEAFRLADACGVTRYYLFAARAALLSLGKAIRYNLVSTGTNHDSAEEACQSMSVSTRKLLDTLYSSQKCRDPFKLVPLLNFDRKFE